MPYVYIGRTTSFIGKPLWEILGNLKNFGVGRIVIRHVMQRYPEPCYFKICKVEAVRDDDPRDPLQPRSARRVRVWAEEVFRGRLIPELVEMIHITYKTDFQLIPKDEEEAFCANDKVMDQNLEKLPAYGVFPPVLRELLIRDMKKQGKPVTEPLMKMLYKTTVKNVRKVADENDKERILTSSFGKTVSPQLYENI